MYYWFLILAEDAHWILSCKILQECFWVEMKMLHERCGGVACDHSSIILSGLNISKPRIGLVHRKYKQARVIVSHFCNFIAYKFDHLIKSRITWGIFKSEESGLADQHVIWLKLRTLEWVNSMKNWILTWECNCSKKTWESSSTPTKLNCISPHSDANFTRTTTFKINKLGGGQGWYFLIGLVFIKKIIKLKIKFK